VSSSLVLPIAEFLLLYNKVSCVDIYDH